MHVQDAPSERGSVLQYVCFKLANEEYAFNIMHIQEVIDFHTITPIPQMPYFVLGVVNIRGNIVPVFDLRRFFSLAEAPITEDTKMLVANIDGNWNSFVVDTVSDNMKIDADMIQETLPVVKHIDPLCISGIIELSGRMVVLIALENMYEDIKRHIDAYHH